MPIAYIIHMTSKPFTKTSFLKAFLHPWLIVIKGLVIFTAKKHMLATFGHGVQEIMHKLLLGVLDMLLSIY